MHLESLVGILALVISLYILWEIRQVLLLAFAALVLATALNRLVRQFKQLSLQRGGRCYFIGWVVSTIPGRLLCAHCAALYR